MWRAGFDARRRIYGQDVVKVGKTPVLHPAEARALTDSIDVTTQAGLRDRRSSA
jgi:hypothetical protein